MYKFIGLYLLVIIGLFVEPDFLGSVGIIVFKLVILAGISYLIYESWNAKSELEDDEEDETVPLRATEERAHPQEVFDIPATRLDTLFNSDERFKQFLLNQFTIIWNYTLPHNGFLLYLNTQDSKVKVLEKRNNASINISKESGFSKLITLLGENEGILIENNLVDDLSFFPFYSTDEYQPQSLLAFKTIIDSEQTLYWFFDADESNFFNIQDKALLLQVNTNTSYTVNETLSNQNLLDNSREIKSASELADVMNTAKDFEACINYFSEFIVNSFEASKLTIAIREPDNETAVIQKSIGIEDSYTKGITFPLNEGLHGWVVLKNKPYLIDNIDKGEYFIPRFSRSEKTNYGLRAFLSVPLQINGEAFGMVSLENKIEDKYNDNDKNRLISFCKILNSAYKRFEENKSEIGE